MSIERETNFIEFDQYYLHYLQQNWQSQSSLLNQMIDALTKDFLEECFKLRSSKMSQFFIRIFLIILLNIYLEILLQLLYQQKMDYKLQEINNEDIAEDEFIRDRLLKELDMLSYHDNESVCNASFVTKNNEDPANNDNLNRLWDEFMKDKEDENLVLEKFEKQVEQVKKITSGQCDEIEIDDEMEFGKTTKIKLIQNVIAKEKLVAIKEKVREEINQPKLNDSVISLASNTSRNSRFLKRPVSSKVQTVLPEKLKQSHIQKDEENKQKKVFEKMNQEREQELMIYEDDLSMKFEVHLQKLRAKNRLLTLPAQFPCFHQQAVDTPDIKVQIPTFERFQINLMDIPDLSEENLAHKNSKEVAFQNLKFVKRSRVSYESSLPPVKNQEVFNSYNFEIVKQYNYYDRARLLSTTLFINN